MSYLWKLLGFSGKKLQEKQEKTLGTPPEVAPFDDIQKNLHPFQINSIKTSKVRNTTTQSESSIANYSAKETSTRIQIPTDYEEQFLQISKEIRFSIAKSRFEAQNKLSTQAMDQVVTEVKQSAPKPKPPLSPKNHFSSLLESETKSEPEPVVQKEIKKPKEETKQPEAPKRSEYEASKPSEYEAPKEIQKEVQKPPEKKKAGFAMTNFTASAKAEKDEDDSDQPQSFSASAGDFSFSLVDTKPTSTFEQKTKSSDEENSTSEKQEPLPTIKRGRKQQYKAMISTDFSKRDPLNEGFSFSHSEWSGKQRGRGNYTPRGRGRGSYTPRGRGRGGSRAPRSYENDDEF